ncbi:hypothetical protein AJ80_08700 [Polytolypa hystricis UAMH7299]|uniref:Origin recognition complex subunit 2 n=1 Tax=Polytolypa hystricis (strain UAMH7299) TaxID=1447883 RepID=A0A2B7X3A8_POLH7|nr:hypothetical protein AJ80_08700 [Polytolypa hystricis UAMH7299]
MPTMKRKQPDPAPDEAQSLNSTPRKRRTAAPKSFIENDTTEDSDVVVETPTKRPSRSTAARPKTVRIAAEPTEIESPTPKAKRKVLFETPTKSTAGARNQQVNGTPSRIQNADRSAKRKSAHVLLDPTEDDAWDGGEQLAQEIWEQEGDHDAGAPNGIASTIEGDAEEAANNDTEKADAAKPKRRAGRPKGAKNRRSPTPEGNLPPHERYFFQNRPGPVQTSNNTLAKLSLLTHEEYFEQLEKYTDAHKDEKEFLLEVHERSFPQWEFELSENFNICLYGYGSKWKLVNRFAEWLHQRHTSPPTIVVVNGYTSSVTVRYIFATIVGAVLGRDTPSKLGTQPTEVLGFLQSTLASNPPSSPLMVFINSIDAPALRRPAHQALLARLASIPSIHVLATADTPNFPLLWDVGLRDQFNFVFHDCTTFAAYDVEINVVDEVHTLLGRKVRRIGGKEGIGFVLKSLPENTQKLYRLLLTEILTLLGDQHVSDDEDGGVSTRKDDRGEEEGEETAIEWRTLYHKAAEEFISSSEMMFRTQLKEFYDHQMVVSQTDPSGAEMLSIHLSREEMEGVLEDLVAE